MPKVNDFCFCFLSQRLAEAAEDADLYHDFNATLAVGSQLLSIVIINMLINGIVILISKQSTLYIV